VVLALVPSKECDDYLSAGSNETGLGERSRREAGRRKCVSSAPIRSETSRLWCRLPAIVKVILTVPLVMDLLGAEVE